MTGATALLHRLLAFFVSTPPIDVIAPPDPPEWERELLRHRGLSEIMAASRANVIDLAERRKQLDAIVSYRRDQ